MAARKIKRTITLAQSRTGKVTDNPVGRHFYSVMSLQNALEPPVGALLTPEEVAAMIDIGWTVNVKEAKS
jgi:hypothetical protein